LKLWTPDPDITDDDLVFCSRIKSITPQLHDIPAEFFLEEDLPEHQFFNMWREGNIQELSGKPVEGVDAEQAMKHLGLIMASPIIQPFHKRAAAAYLVALWFEDLIFLTKD
jgi:hypothetical protein